MKTARFRRGAAAAGSGMAHPGIATLVLLLAACGPSTMSAPASAAATGAGATTSPFAAPAFTPVFASAPCPEDIIAVVVDPPACGYLTVLEDRSRPTGRTIRIFVARIDPPGGTTTPDPMLGLGGSLGEQVEYGGVAPGAARTHRQLYVVDMRGIGHSEPGLDCPEVRAAGPALAGLPLADPAHRTTLVAAVRACHDRLTGAGIDLAAYDLAADAADLEDLRTTLGIARWNVGANGTSSRIGFELAARYPDGIRAMYADSPALPAPDPVSVGAAAMDAALDHLATMCSADTACSLEAPDLRVAVDEAVAKLDAHPLAFDVRDIPAATQLGHPVHVVVDGAALLRWFRASLGDNGGSDAARVVTDALRVLDGRVTATDPLVVALASDPGDCLGLLPGCDRIAFGALYSIECRDLSPVVDRAAIDQAVRGRQAWAELFAPEVILAPCDAWSVAPAVARPATGWAAASVRALLMHGAMDPYTVPSTTLADVAASDPNASVLEIPNQSYNVLGYTDCPRAIRNAWLDLASGPPADTSCLAQIRPLELQP